MFEKKEHSLWTEKYRPIELENYIGNESFKAAILKYIQKGEIPNLILHGVPGTGKTTAAKMIVKNLNCDHLYLNGSDNNGIDTVRTSIKTFASSASFKPIKIVILDDCATLTDQAQQGLLNMIETYSKNTRFIFTTNHLDKLIDAMKSRCTSFKIDPPSKKDVAVHLSKILDKENISYEPPVLAQVVTKYYPDIRKCLNILQECTSSGELLLDTINVVSQSYMSQVIKLIAKPDRETWFNVKKLMNDVGATEYVELFRFLYDNADEYFPDTYEQVIFSIAKAQYQHTTVPDKEINVSAMLLEIIQTNKKQ
jgi:DNA polymerase III delta prime subunit